MNRLLATIDNHDGLASRRELLVNGIDPGWIDVWAWYGRQVIRVRKGWYARSTERRDVIRAWRVGGRLTCVSASEFHAGIEPGPVLHIEVPAGAVRLRDPDSRRAVNLAHAEAVASRCGIHGAGVGRPRSQP